ncbi:hypothetical protein PoB_004085400 [Plakobranchus ocellatus]|uniref:Uncharacterized protein n=1 Tax=Plakobranchus ocellatus TaxID=259542 RepID=A0AAV4B6M6_9GAST|nr:hypothetical protein PoB_004085400 [Plakobranchus ocellatus]
MKLSAFSLRQQFNGGVVSLAHFHFKLTWRTEVNDNQKPFCHCSEDNVFLRPHSPIPVLWKFPSLASTRAEEAAVSRDLVRDYRTGCNATVFPTSRSAAADILPPPFD